MSVTGTPLARPGGTLRLWPLAAGLLILAGLWGGPLPGLARVSFSQHMILHLGVMVGAAPLIALGLSRLRPMREGRRLGALAVGGSILDLVVVWGWHAPALHEAAGLVPWVFVLQQASFLGAGVLVWLPPLAARSRAGAAGGTLAMLMCFAHMSMLGVLLAITPRLIYAPELCLGAFGLGPLGDQHLGGVLMAVAGGPPYLAGGVMLAARLLREEEA